MPNGGPRKGAGRKPFVPTDKDRAWVKAMTAFGASLDDIAKVLTISTRTVQRKFPRELDTGHIEANAKVGKAIYDQAIGGNMTAAIFWAKCRMGWRDVQRMEVTGNEGGPVQVEAAREILAAKFEALRPKLEPDAASGSDSEPSK